MKKCKHFSIGFVVGQPKSCLLEILPKEVMYLAKLYWVGLGRPPNRDIKRIAKEFMKFKFCPKCGEKLDFSEVLALFE